MCSSCFTNPVLVEGGKGDEIWLVADDSLGGLVGESACRGMISSRRSPRKGGKVPVGSMRPLPAITRGQSPDVPKAEWGLVSWSKLYASRT
jgi:hypothetical protein